MEFEIPKQDWVLFTQKVAVWQENHMTQLVREYAELLQDENKPGSERFWNLEKRINQDKRTIGVIIHVKKSNMLWQLAQFIGDGIAPEEELAEFSEDVQQAVRLILSHWTSYECEITEGPNDT